MAINEQAILKSELRWAAVVGVIVAVILAAILFAALTMHINPPSNREFVDPKTLHISAEFTEANLGTRVDPDGQVVNYAWDLGDGRTLDNAALVEFGYPDQGVFLVPVTVTDHLRSTP